MSEREFFRNFRRDNLGDDRELWCEWLTDHGIDPDDVVLTGWIQRDERNCRIRYLSYLRTPGRAAAWVIGRDGSRTPACAVRAVHLDRCPEPFPTP